MAEGPAVPADLPALQQFLDGWIKQRGGYWSPLSQYARLAEEVGELGRELNFEFGDKPRAAKDAGGSVTDMQGQPHRLDSSHIAATNGLLHAPLVRRTTAHPE